MSTPAVQRKLAAILAADVAGYSRLMGADEVGTARALREHREALSSVVFNHSGRIVDVAGDGLLIEFPSIVTAVECAIAVQKLMAERNAGIAEGKRMLFRIGINLGDVIVDGDDILGDGVNVAARLEGIAEPGGICLSADAYRQVKGKVDLAAQDLGEQRLKNIAEPIRVYALLPANAKPIASSAAPTAHAPRLSIVVLPFANLGGDKEQDYFVDGITENLTTDLSRIPGAFVIARNTAFTYKRKAVDARQIGSELGVRYVMEGSVQSGGSRIRVNAQLIDADTGAHLWAERFDKPHANLFDMQDEITARLARAAGVELVAAESHRAVRERPNSMDAVDLAMRGRAVLNRSLSLDRVREARRLFEAALRLDDKNVDALVGSARTHLYELINFFSENPDEQLRVAEAALSKALSLAPDNAQAHLQRATALQASKAPERALSECELAISLDGNLAGAHGRAGLLKIFVGRAEETEQHVSEAMRLSPRDPDLHAWYFHLGVAALYLGRLDAAIRYLRKSVEISSEFGLGYFYLAAALALAGRQEEAADARGTGERLTPTFTISRVRARAFGDNPRYLEQRERLYEGLRRAGVPEE